MGNLSAYVCDRQMDSANNIVYTVRLLRIIATYRVALKTRRSLAQRRTLTPSGGMRRL